MITKMTRYSFVMLSGMKDDFLLKLQDLGVVDITRSGKPVDEHSESILAEINSIKEKISQIRKGEDEFTASLNTEIADARKELSAVEPWGDYDKDKLSAFEPHFYCCSSKKFDSVWENGYALQKVCEKDSKVWFVILGDNTGFPLTEMPAPALNRTQLKAEIADKEEKLKEYKAGLEADSRNIPELQKRIAELNEELGRYLASLKADSAAEDSLVLFEAFAPQNEEQRLRDEFDSMDIIWMAEDAVKEDNPPVKLHNNWFARQFEVLTGMYGMPVYDEFDPTPILAPFFLLFFALCMGDSGYGLLLIAIGLMLKGKKGGLAELWRLIILLGAGTTIVGLFLGTFFGISLQQAAWYPECLKKLIVSGTVDVLGNQLDIQMVMAVIIGIVHICLAMTVKAVLYTTRFGFKEAISTWGWTILIVGGVITGALSLAGLLPEQIVKTVILAIAFVAVLGIFIFNKPGRNPLLNIGAGLWDTYGMATGILGDVLSYIRLYALGLAGGILGNTFNELTDMVLGGNPTWQWIPAVLILLFGHALNLAMSCLGAFVHPLRLTFVEYFKNSGYEGAGRKYSPLKKSTN